MQKDIINGSKTDWDFKLNLIENDNQHSMNLNIHLMLIPVKYTKTLTRKQSCSTYCIITQYNRFNLIRHKCIYINTERERERSTLT